MSGVLRIGISGIVLPGPKKTFPEEFQASTRLTYYGELFNTLEVNHTFYKLPRLSTFEKWSSEVNDDFRFTCKLPRSITHSKSLRYSPEDINTFMNASKGMGNKKGCLLVQFPASINTERSKEVEGILRQIAELNYEPKWNICVEFRDRRWYEDDCILRVLEKLNVSIVLHDMPKSKTPIHLAGNPTYLRFHGAAGDYKGDYGEEFLERYAVMIKDWCSSGKDVYVYFNNTMGEAFQNAQFLKTRIENFM